MSMPTSPTRLLTCGACGATLPYEPEHAGQKCRCGGCGKILTVPGEDDGQPKKQSGPKYVSFHCLVCQSVLSARIEHVGRKAKCPDCYTLNVVPPPPKVKKKQTPQAMHGQQYGLWGVDEAPLPEELAAKLPQFFSVYCGLCNTHMQAQPKHIGMKLKCPDCGTKTKVLEPPPEKKSTPVLVPDGEEYQLDEKAAPKPRPVPTPPAVLEADKLVEYRDQLQSEYGERPKLPRLPTLQGVMRMLVRDPVLAWWLGLSVATTVAALFAQEAMAIKGVGLQSVFEVAFTVLAIVLGGFSLSACSAVSCGILTDSSDGNDRLFNEPSRIPWDWFGATMYIVTSLAMAILPGSGLGILISRLGLGTVFPTEIIASLSSGLSFVLFFPVVLLSMLDKGSPLDIISLRVLSTLLRRPAHWMLFYAQSAVLIAACGVIGLFLVPGYLYVFCPLAIAASLLYFRLLGRFAWWLAESVPAE